MKTIWKTQLKVAQNQVIELPNGSEFLSLQMQGDIVTAWWLIDSEADLDDSRDYQIYVVGTGMPVPDLVLDFLGTVQAGPYVWHYFMKKKNWSGDEYV